MQKITSFTIDHLKLIPGVYVSRVDYAGESPITTFDLRMTRFLLPSRFQKRIAQTSVSTKRSSPILVAYFTLVPKMKSKNS